MLADVVQVTEGGLPRAVVAHDLVIEVPLFRKGDEAARDFGLTELRHVRKQVMDDLAVQVTHQPVDDALARIDVDGVIDGVSHPREVLIARNDVEVRVRRGEVRKPYPPRPPLVAHDKPLHLVPG